MADSFIVVTDVTVSGKKTKTASQNICALRGWIETA